MKHETMEERLKTEFNYLDNGYDATMEDLRTFIKSECERSAREAREEVLREVCETAEDHYWDSLEGVKGMVMRHIRSILDITSRPTE